jgi:hypothetical protein
MEECTVEIHDVWVSTPTKGTELEKDGLPLWLSNIARMDDLESQLLASSRMSMLLNDTT